MGETTAIAWTHATFNPWWGCQRVSPGCGLGKSVGGCYAEALAKRYGHDVWGPTSPRRFFGDEHWNEPLRWNRDALADGERRRVFCASMADVFEDRRDLDDQRARLWELIEKTPGLDWLLLTKRPEHMSRFSPARWSARWPDNIWAGATMESQEYYDRRWPILARVPARVTFVSHEPAIGPLILKCHGCGHDTRAHMAPDQGGCPAGFPTWVISGGESGGGPRAYDLAWARSLRDQCHGTIIKFFLKQLGAAPVVAHGPVIASRLLLKDRRAGAEPSEWPSDLRDCRAFPGAA